MKKISNKILIGGVLLAGSIINYNKDDLLMYQCKKHNFFFTKCLINIGANVNATKYTEIGNPIRSSYLRHKYDHLGFFDFHCIKYDTTPLTLAIENSDDKKNSHGFIKLLLDNGADPCLPCEPKWGMKPIGYAVQYNKLSILKLLHEYGADLNDKYGDGGYCNILGIAIEKNNLPMVKYLVENGFDTSKDFDRFSSYHLKKCFAGKKTPGEAYTGREIAYYLIEKGICLDTINRIYDDGPFLNFMLDQYVQDNFNCNWEFIVHLVGHNARFDSEMFVKKYTGESYRVKYKVINDYKIVPFLIDNGLIGKFDFV